MGVRIIDIWEERQAGCVARLAQCQAELQARLCVLKHTRWKHNSAMFLERKEKICTSDNIVN